MKYYLAPMEGITGYVYRNAYHRNFSPMDRYVTPFLVPNQNRSFKSREVEDVLPDHNRGMETVPQILTNRPEDFLWSVGKLRELGYREVNLNLGCPSGTVTAKGRGAGFLADPEALARFLEQVFLDKMISEGGIEISVKTRLGFKEAGEFSALVEVFNRFSIKELIIHPRVREDFYGNHPNLEAFAWGLSNSRCPVCYNGDLFSLEDLRALKERFPGLEAVMLGRGVIANPFLTGLLKGEGLPSDGRERFLAFHREVLDGYRNIMSGDRNVLFKMKELWAYMGVLFLDSERHRKRIRKADRLTEYEAAVNRMAEECPFDGNAAFRAGWTKGRSRPAAFAGSV